MNGSRASLQGIQDLFLSLRDSSPPDVAAVSPSSFARMAVDSSGAVYLTGWAGPSALPTTAGHLHPGAAGGFGREVKPRGDTLG